jgi:hypothetical protein
LRRSRDLERRADRLRAPASSGGATFHDSSNRDIVAFLKRQLMPQ